MSAQSPARFVAAVVVCCAAVASAAVIAYGFLAPEQMLDTVGVVGFGAAGLVMVVCAVVANLYDLRGILARGL